MFDVIIPTKCHGSALEKLCESIQANTHLTVGYIKFVAVGPTQPKVSWLKWIQHDGTVASAINKGVSETSNPYVVILHDDALLLPQPPSRWLDQLKELVVDSKVAVCGPLQLNKNGTDYIHFFCAALSREVWEKVGPLSEEFPYRDYEIDWCKRAQTSGYVVKRTCDVRTSNGYLTGDFPIFHKGGHTLNAPIEAFVEPQVPKVAPALSSGVVFSKVPAVRQTTPVTAHISTRGRYKTTLPLAIQSISLQSVVPQRLIIFDDGDGGEFFNEIVYCHILNVLYQKGCQVDIIKGEGRGQVLNHQKAIDLAETPYIWRVDDDNSAEPNVLETLLAHISTGSVGAVASSVHFPWYPPAPLDLTASGLIGDIKASQNVQWFKFTGARQVEHLHNTFLFRKEAASHGYPKNLSVVGHREETMFTHEMVLQGWKLLVVGDVITWHLRDPEGGIRLFRDTSLWQSDEDVFNSWALSHRIKFNNYWLIVHDSGLGDHLAFYHIWPDIKKKAEKTGHKIILAVCYPEVFLGEPVISIADALKLDKDLDKYNIYRFMAHNNWSGSLVDAFRAMHGV
jgi:GT2 family glycosyltransferase